MGFADDGKGYVCLGRSGEITDETFRYPSGEAALQGAQSLLEDGRGDYAIVSWPYDSGCDQCSDPGYDAEPRYILLKIDGEIRKFEIQ